MTNDIERDPAYSDENLIWIDMEMTGLQPEVNRVIEVAAIITDKNLNILHKGPVVALHQSDEVLGGMDAWLPNLEAYFHYRYLDVSTLKELTRRWAPEKTRTVQKATKHQALSDIEESIEELQYYRREILKI